MKIKELKQNSNLPQLEIELILSKLLNKEREYIASNLEFQLDKKIINEFQKLEKKRNDNWPLAYLLKEKEFYSLPFYLSNKVLIPRPETETIIDYLISRIKPDKKGHIFIDVGTGSGAIIISLAKEIKKKFKNLFESSLFFGLDISKSAIQIAKKNSEINGLGNKIKFIKSVLIKKIQKEKLESDKKLIITANLPYLTKKQLKETSILKEPKLALYGGKDGLEIYRKLFFQIKKKDLNNFILICEINPEQVERMKQDINSTFNEDIKIDVISDLAKKDRFVVIEKN